MIETLGITYNILVVEDSPTNIEILQTILEDHFNVAVALDGITALDLVEQSPPDLILLDVVMPDMDGYEVCAKVKAKSTTRNIPIIFLTGQTSLDDEEKGFNCGASDYVTKPVHPKTLLARIKTHLRLADQRKLLEHHVTQRTSEILDLNHEIVETQKEIIDKMGSICEGRSKETGNHVKRVAEYSKVLALSYGLSEDQVHILHAASPMHDIGKVAIADDILNKPGAFTPEERKIMETHTLLGYEMLNGSNRKILEAAKITALEHHEKWDGTGYPNNLKGNDINILGRIAAVADVFDALSHDRCYKKAWNNDRVLQLFRDEKGKHFEPKLVDIFFEKQDIFQSIKTQLGD